MNQPKTRLCLVLHNHQPVGNFDNIIEGAYQDSYLPFLDLFESFESLKISLHTSGPLMMWLQQHHPEYLARLAQLVEAGRIEIIGGAFYEPILTMIPQRDRVGQIQRFSDWLKDHLSSDIHGMWMPERVWESNLVTALSEANIKYTVLDDFHFRRAGLTDDELTGYFVLEDEGKIIKVFPGSERLRYLIPFANPQETIDHCRQFAERHPEGILVFGDDGEKFGTWPDTKTHVYENGWLREFFQALNDNQDWLQTSTLLEAAESSAPRGKIYLPDASYREMIEWALPTDRQKEYDHLVHEFQHDHRWPELKQFMSGGFWRNFKVKYPETNLMYARMMYVSRLLEKAQLTQRSQQQEVNQTVLDAAEDHLYQGQCNCPYWHGAFGGVYLPHLRNAIYHQLLTAERLLEKAMRVDKHWVEATSDDFDFDGRQEIRLANEQLVCWISGVRGGQIFELDLMNKGHNLGATIQRKPELYHDKVRAGEQQSAEGAASIHDRVVFKQPDLDQQLFYDHRLRNSLIDHFRPDEISAQALQQGDVDDLGDFADGNYQTTIRRNPDRVQIMLVRQGMVDQFPITLTKGLTLNADSNVIEIAYLIENLPPDRHFNLGVEFNFAGLPDGQDDRYFSGADDVVLGQLQTMLELDNQKLLRLSDDWLGIDVELESNLAACFYTYPVQTVSQSEGGFEAVHQAIAVEPVFKVQSDAQGRWALTMRLKLVSDHPSQRKYRHGGSRVLATH